MEVGKLGVFGILGVGGCTALRFMQPYDLKNDYIVEINLEDTCTRCEIFKQA